MAGERSNAGSLSSANGGSGSGSSSTPSATTSGGPVSVAAAVAVTIASASAKATLPLCSDHGLGRRRADADGVGDGSRRLEGGRLCDRRLRRDRRRRRDHAGERHERGFDRGLLLRRLRGRRGDDRRRGLLERRDLGCCGVGVGEPGRLGADGREREDLRAADRHGQRTGGGRDLRGGGATSTRAPRARRRPPARPVSGVGASVAIDLVTRRDGRRRSETAPSSTGTT